MKNKKLRIIALLFLISFINQSLCSQADNVKVKLITNKGEMTIELFKETPLHSTNFIKLVESGFYEGVSFHRVIKGFMAQAGDPNSKNETFSGKLGQESYGEVVAAEFNSKYYHKKGALCAARKGDEVNPNKESSGSQFYLVQGKTYSKQLLENMASQINNKKKQALLVSYIQNPSNIDVLNKLQYYQQNNLQDSIAIFIEEIKPIATKHFNAFSFSEEAKSTYTTIGGTPFLDGNYTVFGQVIEGLEVIDEICNVKTLEEDIPEEDVIIISMKIMLNKVQETLEDK